MLNNKHVNLENVGAFFQQLLEDHAKIGELAEELDDYFYEIYEAVSTLKDAMDVLRDRLEEHCGIASNNDDLDTDEDFIECKSLI